VITKDMDNKITTFTKPRRIEKTGRTIYIQQLDGNKLSGRLVGHRSNIFIVEDSKDGILKEIHRATIVRFMLVIDGGKSKIKGGEDE